MTRVDLWSRRSFQRAQPALVSLSQSTQTCPVVQGRTLVSSPITPVLTQMTPNGHGLRMHAEINLRLTNLGNADETTNEYQT